MSSFHRWLSAGLRVHAARRRELFQDRLPTARELDDVLLIERLADDADNVSPHLSLLFRQMLLVRNLARHLDAARDDVFDRIGRALVPRDATELVRCLLHETIGRARRRAGAESPGLR